MNLSTALENQIWKGHKIGDVYSMINKNGSIEGNWKIAYYPIFEDGKTGEAYKEPRVLIEKQLNNGIDFREVPIRFLTKQTII